MNNVILIGRLTNDLELKEVGESKVINFSLAVPRSYKNKDGEVDTDFINCSIWNASAENMKEFCKKGDLLAVEGSLQTSTYEKDEVKHYKTEVRVDRVRFLPQKKVEVVEDGE